MNLNAQIFGKAEYEDLDFFNENQDCVPWELFAVSRCLHADFNI
jgi:hypothetical protein